MEPPLSALEKLGRVIGYIQAARSIDDIFIQLKQHMLDLFDAERVTIYAVDRERREIYSRFLDIDTIKEIRVPVEPASLAGYVAKTGECVNIADAYDTAELARISNALSFDDSWDRKTGFRTRQVLAVPVMDDDKDLTGVIQLLNKKHLDRFTAEDERNTVEIAKTLASTFHALHRFARRRPGKFDYLLSQDLLTPEELNEAITKARRQRTDVESILLTRYPIGKDDLGVALSMFYKCPFVEFSEEVLIEPALLAPLRLEYLKFNFWVPLARRDKVVEVLIDNPHDVHKVDTIKRAFAGSDVRFSVGLRQDILQFIDSAADNPALTGSISSILGELVDELPDAEEERAAAAAVDLNGSAVVRLAHQLIIDAHKAGASDVHIEPRGPKQDTLVRFRIDGACIQYERVPPAFRRDLVARLKVMARLDISERRKPQDGKIAFRIADQEIELRVATLPTVGGNEDVALRFLSSNEAIGLEKLGLTERNLREIMRMAGRPYGLILCVGPTGSGKTTTMHAVLGFINKPDRRILTAEDPVEITQEGLRQVQVQPKIGLTFAVAMRAFLRADPDVIMVGEMRDRETATIAVEASLTGHLVLSTLHTNSAVVTVTRLLDMGLDSFTFADSMLGVLAQRLVKCVCRDCKEAYHPPVETYEGLAEAYGPEEFEHLGLPYDDTFVLYRGRGCAACNRTGYKGRAGIHELLIASEEIRRLIQTRAHSADIVTRAKAEGMTTLVQDGILKVLQGVTDLQQVRAVAIQ